MKPIIAKDKSHLKLLIKEHLIIHGNSCDLNHIDTSLITDMSYLFFKSQFNGNISGWNVSSVTNMECMFWFSQFNGDISKWDVSHVTNMQTMFNSSNFNGNISNWNVSSVSDLRGIFNQCSCETPWWYITDNDLRKEVMDKYVLMKKLDNHLQKDNVIPSKKIKL